MTRHILITGNPGIGKTTLIKKIVNHLTVQNVPCNGFYTEEIRSNGTRIGFDVVTLDGNRGILARKGSDLQTIMPKVGQYNVDLCDFEKVALPMFEEVQFSHVTIIDEIGKMELCSKKFEAAVGKTFKKKNNCIIATVPIKGRSTIVEQLKKDQNCQLFTVTYDNRNVIFDQIIRSLNI